MLFKFILNCFAHILIVILLRCLYKKTSQEKTGYCREDFICEFFSYLLVTYSQFSHKVTVAILLCF